MLYIEIDEEGNAVNDVFTEGSLRERLGENVTLPKPIKDTHINALGYACVDSVLTELKQNKDTLLKPVFMKNKDPEEEAMFTREWEIVPYPEDISERVERKRGEIREERDRLLSDTDFAGSDDNLYMKDEYVAYRNALRDLPQQNEDPFLIEFPVRPVDQKYAMDLEGKKNYAFSKNEERFRRALSDVKGVDTGLGFLVLGNRQNYELLKGSRDIGINIAFDTDNNRHELSDEDMIKVANSIEIYYQTAFETKKTTEDRIKDSTEDIIDEIIDEIKG